MLFDPILAFIYMRKPLKYQLKSILNVICSWHVLHETLYTEVKQPVNPVFRADKSFVVHHQKHLSEETSVMCYVAVIDLPHTHVSSCYLTQLSNQVANDLIYFVKFVCFLFNHRLYSEGPIPVVHLASCP